jgi:predicted nucleic acid-binding protein
MTEEWLIDKSALTRIPTSPDAEVWMNRVDRGLVRISVPTLLEIGYSAQTAAALDEALSLPPISLMPIEQQTPASESRALQVQRLLATRGYHRAPSVADLLLAAIAEQARLTILHFDKDFELIAAVTGQPTQRITPALADDWGTSRTDAVRQALRVAVDDIAECLKPELSREDADLDLYDEYGLPQ